MCVREKKREREETEKKGKRCRENVCEREKKEKK
jgi:hypothetical protein